MSATVLLCGRMFDASSEELSKCFRERASNQRESWDFIQPLPSPVASRAVQRNRFGCVKFPAQKARVGDTRTSEAVVEDLAIRRKDY